MNQTKQTPSLKPENDLSRRYLRILERWLPFGVSMFEPWDRRPDCGHFLGGVFSYGQETSNVAITVTAALQSAELNEGAVGTGRDELARMARAGIRYLCFTHDTGPADCVRPTNSPGRAIYEGKKWGERGQGFFRESQCGVGIASLAVMQALLGDVLEDEERGMLRAIARDYLNRFAETEPKSGVYFDTQMEENAWTGLGLVGSALLLRDDPSFDEWLTRAYRWFVCSASKPEDIHDGRALTGSTTVGEMVGRRCTVLPDNTAENHGFVHPSYMASGINLSTMAHIALGVYGSELPGFTEMHLRDVYEQLWRWTDSLGVPLAVQGMDWPYFPIAPWNFNHAAANVRFESAVGARLERRALDAAETMIEAANGRMIPEATARFCHGTQDPALFRERQIHRLAYAYLLHRVFGPGVEPESDEAFGLRQRGVLHYPHGGSLVHVHDRGRSCYSWRNGMTAFIAPSEGIAFAGQRPGSILAQVALGDGPVEGRIVHHRVREESDRVAACTIEVLEALEDGARPRQLVRREVFYAGFPGGETVVSERLTAIADVTVTSIRHGMMQVINDPIFPSDSDRKEISVRTVFHAGGTHRFEGFAAADQSADRSVAIPADDRSGWVNVDDRLGIVFVGDGHATYSNRHTFAVWRGVEDDLELNGHEPPFTRAPGKTICELTALFCAEQHHAETRDAELSVTRSDGVLDIQTDYGRCIWNASPQARNIDGLRIAPGEPAVRPTEG